MNKKIAILGIIVIVLVIVIILFIPRKNRLVCRSKEGNIILKYNDKTVTDYRARYINFNMDMQKPYIEKVGIEEYLNQFSTWFSNNTTGTCKLKK